MAAKKKCVLIGLLGTNLDRGVGPERWESWRPSVSLCQQDDLLIHRFELISQQKFTKLAEIVATDLAQVSPETEVRHASVEVSDWWDFEEVYGALLDFAQEYPFKPEREDYLVHITTGSHVAQICLFLLTESRHIPGRLIQTSPPSDRDRHARAGRCTVVDLDLSKYDRLAARFAERQKEARTFLKSGIATRNKAFNRLIEQIEQVAICSRDPMLLMGPTGAGKSQLARRIFELKKARHQIAGEFVEVNCATVRGDGAMSTLFGHVRGSFTGALKDRPGLLRTADGGLLFLDEIGELCLDEQAMLLRALEEKRFLPVGADKEVSSDFQLIAGTNRDLSDAVARGTFREDLLARINLWTFRLPGLRERVEDLEPNLEYELERASQRGGTRLTMSAEARREFLAFAESPAAKWSANFRDLNAAVSRMATLAPGGRITKETVADEITRLRSGWQSTHPNGGGGDDALLASVLSAEKLEELDLFDRLQLAAVIRICRESTTLSEAGRKLFAVSRTKRGTANDADRLRKFLARFELDWRACRGG
ncbi:MAG: RNA repair transcriptional activator RtcR [Chthoniobacteraceae bacterium]